MPRKDRPTQRPAEDRPEFPKPLVRLTRQADGPGGFGCEVRLVGDSDGVSAAEEEGYATIDPHAGVLADFVEYPKWVYHADGRRQIIYTAEEADALDGFEDAPGEQDGEAASKEVPPPVAQATAGSLKNRPPVPVDRG